MPSTIAVLLEASGLRHEGCVCWETPVPLSGPGIYLVGLDKDPSRLAKTLPDASISLDWIDQLLRVRPELRLDGRRPSGAELARRLAGFWIPDETVLYVGVARTSVRARVGAYYRTLLGARRPHAGGWFLKTLANLQSLYVHYAVAANPLHSEDAALGAFVANGSDTTRKRLHDATRPLPFANLEWPQGLRKLHGIRGACG